MTVRILDGDVRDRLRDLPDASVQCCVTSPPYYGLRDYGVPGQIGLEPTLAEYIANMVAVFREVRRVLRDDGTLWLNIGDSYAAARGGTHQPAETLAGGKNGYMPDGKRVNRGRGDTYNPTRDAAKHGLKHKDLMMVPARLAIALQEPYYVGKIKRIDDRVWLAAMVDAEGGMYIHKRKAGQHAGDGYLRQTDNYSPGLEVCNTHKAIVDRCAEITGVGSISVHTEGRRQPLYRWHVRSQQCRDLTREIYPYLIGKQHQARLIIGCPTTGKDAAAAHEALKLLHRGSEVIVDFRIPESLYDPGWFLRSDIVWAKPNPMPESVTDRPTSAHEHIFLLTKSRKYFYDADAIRTEPTEESVARLDRADLREKPGWMEAFQGNPPARLRRDKQRGHGRRHDGFNDRWDAMPKDEQQAMGANARNVWTIATKPFSEAHFATFPPEIPERCIKAGSRAGDTILDPFLGSGTTLLVADRLGRDGIGIELNPTYAAMARRRIEADCPMFAEVCA